MLLSHLRPGSTDTPIRYKDGTNSAVPSSSLRLCLFLSVDTASGGSIISAARQDAKSEPAVTETETRDKLEALQERLETLRDSL